MASYTEYSNRMADRYAALLPEAVVPMWTYRGPRFALREVQRVKEDLERDRKRAIESRIRTRLEEQAQVQLTCQAPFGDLVAVRDLAQTELRFVLLSQAGAGKTTALRELAAHPLAKDVLTALVDLPALAASESALPDFLAADAQANLSLDLSADFFLEALKSGRILLCLDGLDEIVGVARRAQMVSLIETLAKRFVRARFIVTARSNAYQPLLSSTLFASFVLRPWSESVAADLERAWNASLDDWTVDGRSVGEPFYAEKRRLWQHLALAMREQGVSVATTEQAQTWLADAAERDGALKLNKRRAARTAESLLQESVPNLDLIVQTEEGLGFSSRLLQDVLTARSIVSRALSGGVDSAWAQISPYLGDVHWREPIVIAFQFLSQEQPALWAELLTRLVAAGDQDPVESSLHRYLLLAAQALAGSDLSGQLDAGVQQRIVEDLVAWLRDPKAAGRQQAVNALFELGGVAAAAEAILQVAQLAIDDTKELSSRQAAAEAERVAAKEAEAAEAAEKLAILKAAQKPGATEEEKEAARALQLQTPEPDAEPVEADLAVGLLDDWARQAAGLLLGRLGRARKQETVSMLQAMVENDDEKNVLVRKAAAMALGQLFLGVDPADELYAAVQAKMMDWAKGSDLPIDVRGVAADTLGNLLVDSGQPDLLDEYLTLARGVSKEDKILFTIQIAAARALKVLAQKAADPQLNDRLWELASDEQVDPTIRIELAETLGKQGREQAAASMLLSLGLNTKLRYVDQRDAFDALGRLGYADAEIVEQTKAIAQTTDRNYKDFVRLAAARALGGLGEPALSLQNVLQLIADKSIYRSTRHDAFTIIGEVGMSGIEALDEATVAILRVWAKEENTTEDIRERAIESLSMLNVTERAFVQDLIAVLQNKREYRRVRQKAAWALGELPQMWAKPASDGLQAVLYDPDEKNDVLRVEVARSVLRFVDEQPAVDYLKAVTEQAYMAVARHDAAQVLIEYGMIDDAIEPLLTMVLSPEIADYLRQSSMRTLGLWAIGNPEVIAGVQRVFEQPELEPNVRQEAYAALTALVAF